MSKILVIRGGAIGDFILTLPVFTALRQQFPSAHLEVLGYPHIAQLALAGGLVDEVRSIEARPLAGFFAARAALDATLQQYFAAFPVIISYLYDPDQTFQINVLRCTKGQFIAGPHRPDETNNVHATDTFLAPLQRLAIFDADPMPKLEITPSPMHDSRRWIALHPGSGSERKNWPLENWIALAKELAGGLSIGLLLVGGEAEQNKVQKIVEHLVGAPVELACNLPLAKLAERLARCAAFVGHDSGITHLAAALGIPTIAIWGDTPQAVWRPRGDHVQLIRSTSGLNGISPKHVLSLLPQPKL